jgi:peptidoglycan/LPS O-acetylase OafA/YrhL
MKSSHPTHFERIDVLRAVAILMVFLHHFSLAVQHDQTLVVVAKVPDWAVSLFWVHQFGFLGVKLFFVISGFCIHNSYLSWRTRNPVSEWTGFLVGFAHRRFWRIWPPYFIALVGLYFWRYEHPFTLASLKHLALHATLLNTLFPGFFYNINPSFWSIAVEWQLYLVYPLLLWAVVRFGILRAFLAGTFVAALFQFELKAVTSAPYVVNLPFSWWYDWAIGALLAGAYAERRMIFRAHGLLALVVGVLVVVVFTRWPSSFLTWAMPPLFFAILLEGCLWSRRPLARWERVLVPLGLCSYSFYLMHQPLTELAVAGLRHIPFALGPWIIWVGACGLVGLLLFGVSFGSYRWIELASVKVGDRLWKRRPSLVALSVPVVATGKDTGGERRNPTGSS